ncbi:MAG: glycosyltransferase [Gammaproteobacteria bacterium]|nr:glycosyltransferase [Gammaproteobacteria bacterium]
MERIKEVVLPTLSLERYVAIVGAERVAEVNELAANLKAKLDGGVIWHINSTAVGGGVAEMLPPVLGYCRDLHLDARWLVISGSPEFFRLTKRLHHALHGQRGDGSQFDAAAREVYDRTMRENLAELLALVQPGDIVVLHDPQTIGLAPGLSEHGAKIIWRCHIGRSEATAEADAGWEFLAPYLKAAPRYLFSRDEYVPDRLDHGKSDIVAPSIDAFTPKNQPMLPETVRAILVHTGLLAGLPVPVGDLGFERADGSRGRVDRFVDTIRCGPPPTADVALITQVSRWDPLKDHIGVMEGFARWHTQSSGQAAELVLAGPTVQSVADDPEGPEVFREVFNAWCALPHEQRARVHLCMLPMVDVDENAAIVNALQRQSQVIVQKSLQEGFGLTLTEAMWKRKAVIASKVGGLQDQIEHGDNGLLLDDPQDTDEFVAALGQVLGNFEYRRSLGEQAGDTVNERYLAIRTLRDHLSMMRECVDE